MADLYARDSILRCRPHSVLRDQRGLEKGLWPIYQCRDDEHDDDDDDDDDDDRICSMAPSLRVFCSAGLLTDNSGMSILGCIWSFGFWKGQIVPFYPAAGTCFAGVCAP